MGLPGVRSDPGLPSCPGLGSRPGQLRSPPCTQVGGMARQALEPWALLSWRGCDGAGRQGEVVRTRARVPEGRQWPCQLQATSPYGRVFEQVAGAWWGGAPSVPQGPMWRHPRSCRGWSPSACAPPLGGPWPTVRGPGAPSLSPQGEASAAGRAFTCRFAPSLSPVRLWNRSRGGGETFSRVFRVCPAADGGGGPPGRML